MSMNGPRIASITAVLAGAAGSLGLMFYVGHRNPSLVLMTLFTIWVLSPFAALGVAWLKRWTILTPAALYGMMLLVTLGSLAAYADIAFWHPRPKPASVFLLVPLASWLLIGISMFSLPAPRARAGPS